jgi:hypothetical protein
MRTIFVFGSNYDGRHGKGAAKTALERFGAVSGVGKGLRGDSYAIPTKDYSLRVLDLTTIKNYVKTFIEFARENTDMEFYITAVGTGLAGHKHETVAPMFLGIPPDRCSFPFEWQPFLGSPYRFRAEGEMV